MKVVALIPAYQEEESIADTIKAMLSQSRLPDKIVVIPNGCTDKTAEIARRYPVEVLELPKLEHKKSEALNTGWQIYGREADVVICLDADTILPDNAVRDWVDEIASDPLLGGSSSKFTMLANVKRHNVLGLKSEKESAWAEYLTRIQASEFSSWTETALRRGFTTVLAGTGCAISGRALREVVAKTGQPGPWSYKSLTEDFFLTHEIRSLGYKCHVSPNVRAYTDSMKTTKALLGQRMKWQVGTVEDLLSIGINRLTLVDWWQQFAGLSMALIRLLWLSLIVLLVVTGSLSFSAVWWILVPVAFAVGQGLLSLRIPHRDWKDVVLAFAIVPSEHFSWLRSYWFVIGWIKALKSKFTGKQEDLWTGQYKAEAA